MKFFFFLKDHIEIWIVCKMYAYMEYDIQDCGIRQGKVCSYTLW